MDLYIYIYIYKYIYNGFSLGYYFQILQANIFTDASKAPVRSYINLILSL